MEVSKSTSPPLSKLEIRSNLEHIFMFQDPAFREYIMVEDLAELSYHDLISVAKGMETGKHGVIANAAAWAWYEAASIESESVGPVSRSEALASAIRGWEQAAHALSGASMRAERIPRLSTELADLSYRSSLAAAYEPFMYTLTQARLRRDVSNEEFGQARDKSHGNVAALSTRLMESIKYQRKVRGWSQISEGIINEIVAGLLLQEGMTDRISLPASLRDDHNVNPRRRSDVQVIHLDDLPNRRILVQVGLARKKRIDRDILKVDTRSDLLLDPTMPTITTLRIFMKKIRGEFVADPLETALQSKAQLIDRRVQKLRARIS